MAPAYRRRIWIRRIVVLIALSPWIASAGLLCWILAAPGCTSASRTTATPGTASVYRSTLSIRPPAPVAPPPVAPSVRIRVQIHGGPDAPAHHRPDPLPVDPAGDAGSSPAPAPKR